MVCVEDKHPPSAHLKIYQGSCIRKDVRVIKIRRMKAERSVLFLPNYKLLARRRRKLEEITQKGDTLRSWRQLCFAIAIDISDGVNGHDNDSDEKCDRGGWKVENHGGTLELGGREGVSITFNEFVHPETGYWLAIAHRLSRT